MGLPVSGFGGKVKSSDDYQQLPITSSAEGGAPFVPRTFPSLSDGAVTVLVHPIHHSSGVTPLLDANALPLSYRLCNVEDTPEYLRSPFILTGYRVHFPPYLCLRSLVRLHNETVMVVLLILLFALVVQFVCWSCPVVL